MVKIAVIAGSTRPGRFVMQPAEWITDKLQKTEGVEVELIDLADVDLPFLDTETPPMMAQGNYEKEPTNAWGERIGGFDGFVWVTPEYNRSTSAVLKNAIDHLNVEWNYKPVSFISYGSIAGGARAVEHLRGVAGELRMYDLRDMVALVNYWNNIGQDGAYVFSDADNAAADAVVTELVTWTKHMKNARES